MSISTQPRIVIDPMIFEDDLEPRQLPVRVGKEKYILREADAGAESHYHKELLRTIYAAPDGSPRTDKNSAMNILLSRCLYFAEDDGSQHGKLPLDGQGNADRSKLVPLERILAFRPLVADKMKQWVEDNSDFTEKDTVELLERKIAELKHRLEVLKKDERTEAVDPAKNGPSAGEATSS